jgi:hypothetical protein
MDVLIDAKKVGTPESGTQAERRPMRYAILRRITLRISGRAKWRAFCASQNA